MTFPRQVPHIPRLSELHELREDVVYAHADGVPLRFDHYRPRKVDGPAAAVIFVHGGAWMHGARPRPAATPRPFPARGTGPSRSRTASRPPTASPPRSTTCATGSAG